MRDKITIVQCTPEELRKIVRSEMKSEIADLTTKINSKEQSGLLTRIEVCEFLKINLSTLYLWTKKGKIPSHTIGNRVYYKLNEVLDSLVATKS